MIVAEINSWIDSGDARTVAYNGSAYWDGGAYFGMSVDALRLLGATHGYTLVYCESRGVNCFLVLDSAVGFDVRAYAQQARAVGGRSALPAEQRAPNYFGRGERRLRYAGLSAASERPWVRIGADGEPLPSSSHKIN